MERVEKDIAEAVNTISDVANQSLDIGQTVKTLNKRVKDENFKSDKGLSFLEVKNQLMLSYLTNLTYLMYKKVCGQQIEKDASVDRLVEIRTVMEKLRPIDQKLKYQIDKLLTSAATGSINEDDPLRFRANPENMMNKIEESDDTENEDDENNDNDAKNNEKFKSNRAYVPPKLSAMHYRGDETVLDQKQKLLDRARKRALSSNIMQELRKEYDEGPEEVRESKDLQRLKEDKTSQRKNEYEEDYMLRLPITKQEKHKSRRVATMSSLGGIAHFDDISALDTDVADFSAKKKKGNKKPLKKTKKGGFRKRKWK